MLEKFDNYHLISKIATGGMAEIFLAKHINSPATSMPIAIKKILRQYSTNASFIKMFLAEARIICNISHENIVRIYDFGKFDGLHYIAMEYVFGQNLGTVINKLSDKQKKIPLDLVLETSLAVLNGLDHAHNTRDKNGIFLNVIHLDMNPNNILISYDGKIKVVDFGIAHATYTKIIKNNLQSIQGTYGYLSPEQCREEELDRRSDIFSFGVILYEMLSGKPLFKHLESDAVIINAILHEEVADIRSVAPEVPQALARIVHKALEKDRENRYISAYEMMTDLKNFQATLEFNPEAETLASLLKKEFAAHYIKMTKVLERAQAAYLMDELFKDIGQLEEIDLNEKVRLKKIEDEEELSQRQLLFPGPVKKHKKKISKLAVFAAVFFIVAVISGVGLFFSVNKKEEFQKVFIFTTPPGAQIYIDGEDTGLRSPAEMKLMRGRSYVIECKKDEFSGGLPFVPDETNDKVNMKLTSAKEK